MDNIKIIRLKSGEDVIASCFYDEDYTMLQNPMLIIFKRNVNGRTMMLLLPWLPIEIIENNSATIVNTNILTEFIPKKSLIKYYHDNMIELEEQMKEYNDDYSLEEQMEEYDDEGLLEGENHPEDINKKLYH